MRRPTPCLRVAPFPPPTPHPPPTLFCVLPPRFKTPLIYALFPRVSLRPRTLFACFSNPPPQIAPLYFPPLLYARANPHAPFTPNKILPFLACLSNAHSLKTFLFAPFSRAAATPKTPPYLCPLPSRVPATTHTLCVSLKSATPHPTAATASRTAPHFTPSQTACSMRAEPVKRKSTE